MRVFPLIHSRTGGCDYSSKFAVRPPSFKEAEIKWARSKILPATRNISLLNGVRYVVAAKGGICIAGVVCTMKYFVNNFLNSDEQKAAQPYADIQGTKYGVFLGYAFNKGDAPNVSYSDLWKWFHKYLKNEWSKKYFDGVTSEPEDCDSLSGTKDFSPTAECFSAQIYDAAKFKDKELFERYIYLAAKTNEEIAFCSNIENIQRVEEEFYNAVTTSAGNIAKLKAKEADAKRSEVPKPKEDVESPEKKTNRDTKSESTKGKLTTAIIAIVAIILLVIAIIFLVKSQENEQNEREEQSRTSASINHTVSEVNYTMPE